MSYRLTHDDVENYHRDGYIIVKGLFNAVEAAKLYQAAITDISAHENAINLNDNEGKKTKLTLWYEPGDDIYSDMLRTERMVDGVAKLLDSHTPVCHFHTKLMQKEPRIGGAWEWHQDYGYWYKHQFLYPDQLISVMIALSEATKLNGCLQVIAGSHKLGRVNHGFAGEQVGADMSMVELCLKTMPLVYVELEPGDALFFHPNLLHRSAANLSDHARWSIISCYNSLSNPAYNDPSSSWSKPLEIISDEVIMTSSAKVMRKRDFLAKDADPGRSL